MTFLLAGYPALLRDPLFRAFFLVGILTNASFNMQLAYQSLWLHVQFQARPSDIALFFAIGGICGALLNPAIGVLSDLSGRRRRYIVGIFLLNAVVSCGLALSPDLGLALVLAAFIAVSAYGPLMALLYERLVADTRLDRHTAMTVFSTARGSFVFGTVLGPAAASVVVALIPDLRVVLVAAAAINFGAAAFALSTLPAGTPRTEGEGYQGRGLDPLVLGGAAIALLLLALASQVRNQLLPLYVVSELGRPAAAVGPAFSIAALVTILVTPYTGLLADRLRPHRALYVAGAVLATYCVLQALAPTYETTLAAQAVIGLGIALLSIPGLMFAQTLLPRHVAAATSLLPSAWSLSPLVLALVVAPVAEAAGIRAAFALTAGLVVIGTGGVALSAALRGRRAPPGSVLAD